MDHNTIESQDDLGYGKLFSKLWHRRLWFLGVFTGVLAIAVPLALIKPAVYQSYMQILAESNYQGKEIKGGGYENQNLEQQFADVRVEVDYATQIKVLVSYEILQRVVKKLSLNDSAESTNAIVTSLRESISVYQVVDESADSNNSATKIIQVSYVGSSPEQTQKVLQAIEEVYLEYNLEQQEKRLRDAIAFIERQIPQARQDFTETEAALTKLTKEKNLISPEAEATSIRENIRQIARERAALKAQQGEIIGSSSTREKQLGVSADNALALSRLSQSPRYQNLLSNLKTIEQNLAVQQTKFTNDNPTLQNTIEERKNVKNLLYEEAERILGELPANFRNDLESLQKQGLVGSDTEIASAVNNSQATLTGIRQRDASLAQTEAQLKQRLVNFPELISQYRSLAQESQIQREALQRLLQARQELEIELNRGGNNWQIIEPPQAGEQIAPNLAKDLLLSLVVASFLGGFAAFAKDFTDETIYTSEEIEDKTSFPILGITPRLPISSSKKIFTQLPFASNSHKNSSIKDVIQWQPFREAVDLIYENLKLSDFNSSLIGSSLQSIAVTSAIAGEGKSTFTLGLALIIARHRQKVLVIDGDLRFPSLHEPFDLANHSGLTNFLAGEVDRPLIQQVSLAEARIDLITAGTVTKDPVKMLNSSRFERFIAQQKEHYDLILVDTPPAIGMVDALKIASICDTSLMITRLNKAKVSELLKAMDLFKKLNVLGIIANDAQNIPRVYEKRPKYLLPQQV